MELIRFGDLRDLQGGAGASSKKRKRFKGKNNLNLRRFH
jgi:hypothetical protein